MDILVVICFSISTSSRLEKDIILLFVSTLFPQFQMRNSSIVRGDVLKIHCQYDTSQETAVVTGGEATTQEMCLSYLPYYITGTSQVQGQDVSCFGAPTVETVVSGLSFC